MVRASREKSASAWEPEAMGNSQVAPLNMSIQLSDLSWRIRTPVGEEDEARRVASCVWGNVICSQPHEELDRITGQPGVETADRVAAPSLQARW